jgi:hypothetical protein
VFLEQLTDAHRRREPRRTRADDQHARVDALVRRVARLGDEFVRAERRGEVGRPRRHEPFLCFTSSVSFGTISNTGETMFPP